MSFFRAVGGKFAEGEYRELKVANDGSAYVLFTPSSPSDKIDEAIVNNAAFMLTKHQQVPRRGYYTVFVTVPDDSAKLFYVDWSLSSQREGDLKIIEGSTVVGGPSSLDFENRNRNSSATTAVVANALVNTFASGDPETAILGNAGAQIWEHYFPRDVDSTHPVGGRLILKNDTQYAFKFDAANLIDNEISFRLDLAEIDA